MRRLIARIPSTAPVNAKKTIIDTHSEEWPEWGVPAEASKAEWPGCARAI